MSRKSAAKRRKKAAVMTLPGGDVLPQRIPQGRPRKPPEDATRTATEARVRYSGITDAKEATQPLCGTDLGLCIRAITIEADKDRPERQRGDERTALENVWAVISASHRNYCSLVIGQTGTAKGATIAMVPEPMQTDQSLRVDLRTHDEKVAAAKASWANWRARIKALPLGLNWALMGALDGFMGEGRLWADQAPTTNGRLAVEGLRRLALND